jgi:hypothetical protein
MVIVKIVNKTMKEPINFFLLIILFVAIGVGGWKLQRYVHYKLSYSSMVQEQINVSLVPLKVQIADLQHQILILQTNK